ncbi:YkoF family thiamine/hydroxymethylpyrimidine-binding protein [Brachybacterium sp. J144]|uniref:YkoF family thiamine/hydroxymethylpyrimidine-binding protein n=1 Tax=Brachybacterium sp. J144 TaxID=3116487 RepID=UPI002E7815A4|nr:YkoF family thiamine/hydroxymethylpyrimidine-binding protein [Brachybacterium sp. J144]MEE1651961.1 YkoF family thiamine/hydroxymethylpyrimidine-binding protein [Brachybacterium sp. J144]
MTTPPAAPTAPADPSATPLGFGVGARVTAAVMSADYARILVGALSALDLTGLVRETGDVSTYLGGHETHLQRALIDLGEALARTEHHATMSVLLSRGCPGEVACELPGGAGPRVTAVPPPRRTGRFASAEWALYPLADAVAEDGTPPDHMRDVYAAIDHARELGTFRGSEHFVTRLEGDLGDVIATAVAGWVLVGRGVQHVTSHLTISLNSPSHDLRELLDAPAEISPGATAGTGPDASAEEVR